MITRKWTLVKLILVAFLVALPPLYYFSQKSNSSVYISNKKLLFPNLVNKFDEIGSITLANHSQTLNISRGETVWSIENKADFPAIKSKVEDLLYELSDLTLIDAKTTDRSLFAMLNLLDIDNPISDALLIRVNDKHNKKIAEILVGKRDGMRVGDKYYEEIFIRDPNEDQTWLVRGLLPETNHLKEWVDQPLINLIEADKVKSISVFNSQNLLELQISKSEMNDQNYSLHGLVIEPGKKIDYESINSVAYEVAELEFDDVIAKSSRDLDLANAISITVETFDGLVLDIKAFQVGNDVFVQVQSDVSIDTSIADADINRLQDRSREFNRMRRNWYFKVSSDFYKHITASKSDFLMAEDEPEFNDG